jgi:hypothetical protein
MPDRAIDQLFQGRREVFPGFPVHDGMIQNVEDVDQLAVIFINLINTNAQYVVPNQIFHHDSPASNSQGRQGVEFTQILPSQKALYTPGLSCR